MIRVGVDVGGTFTDIVLEQTATGIGQKIFVHKVASTPSDQSVGVVQGIVEICGSARRRARRNRHCLSWHDGCDQHGDRAYWREGRHDHDPWLPRYFAYGAAQAAAQFLAAVRRALAVEAAGQAARPPRRDERIMPPDGEIDVPLAVDEVEEAAETFRQARHGGGRRLLSVLVPQQRARGEGARDRQARLPDAFVCCSCEVVNVIREYERFSRCAMNGYIGPKTAALSQHLESGCARTASRRWFASCSPTAASQRSRIASLPIGLLLSGPAGGVIGGRWTGDIAARRTSSLSISAAPPPISR